MKREQRRKFDIQYIRVTAGYAVLPVDLLIDKSLTPMARLLYAYLYHLKFIKHEESRPSCKELGSIFGRTPINIRRTIRKLIDRKLLTSNGWFFDITSSFKPADFL